MTDVLKDFGSAVDDFRKARSQADMKKILARFTGESTELLSFDEVRQKLRARGSADRGLQDIPLDAIVGSVGRYNDFTRDFLPREDASAERWARIKVAATGLAGLPPIEVYQIGQVYFVKDGNHRVSVARQLRAKFIQAYVTEIQTRVPLTPDIRPDELILKAEYAVFLEKTSLDKLRPEADLSVTVPGQYEILLEHIEVHRYFMGLEMKRDIPYKEAVVHWYDTVYLPVVQIIRERGVLDSFPNRTETDLYLWIAEHRAALAKEIGWEVPSEEAASDLVNHFSSQPRRVVARLSEKILESISLDKLEPGPPPGQWRKERLAARGEDRLFRDILVPVNGDGRGWYGLEQALVLARKENARLHGLHVIPTEEQRESYTARMVQQEFERRCQEAGIPGELYLVVGEVPRQICSRARWTDLVVTNLAYPPAPQPFSRLSSGFRELLQRCPRPLLATPQTSTQLNSALLAYDGSLKAREALFVATYLSGRWQIPLVVVTALDSERVTMDVADEARDYLESHGVQATYVQESGPAAEAILTAAETHQSELLIMGGYGYNPLFEVMLGSAVDQILRESRKPVLVCR